MKAEGWMDGRTDGWSDGRQMGYGRVVGGWRDEGMDDGWVGGE